MNEEYIQMLLDTGKAKSFDSKRPSPGYNVSILVNERKDKNRFDDLSIVFLKPLAEKVNITGRVSLLLSKNRLYFMPCGSDKGVAINATKKNARAMYSLCDEERKELTKFCGEHTAKYDDFIELYYIEEVKA